ncbi:MAG TPA: hypothetical protein VK543_08765 [Puia sp.]|nr:hypothetical protein [Puia sp.]
MNLIYLFYSVLFVCSLKGDIQHGKSKIIISEAHLTNGTLKVLFKNNGNKAGMVPVLNYRLGYDKKSLYDKFYYFKGDTLFVLLRKEINHDLYSIKTSHNSDSTQGKLYYVDKKIKPKTSYWMSARLNGIGNPKLQPPHLMAIFPARYGRVKETLPPENMISPMTM